MPRLPQRIDNGPIVPTLRSGAAGAAAAGAAAQVGQVAQSLMTDELEERARHESTQATTAIEQGLTELRIEAENDPEGMLPEYRSRAADLIGKVKDTLAFDVVRDQIDADYAPRIDASERAIALRAEDRRRERAFLDLGSSIEAGTGSYVSSPSEEERAQIEVKQLRDLELYVASNGVDPIDAEKLRGQVIETNRLGRAEKLIQENPARAIAELSDPDSEFSALSGDARSKLLDAAIEEQDSRLEKSRTRARAQIEVAVDTATAAEIEGLVGVIDNAYDSDILSNEQYVSAMRRLVGRSEELALESSGASLLQGALSGKEPFVDWKSKDGQAAMKLFDDITLPGIQAAARDAAGKGQDSPEMAAFSLEMGTAANRFSRVGRVPPRTAAAIRSGGSSRDPGTVLLSLEARERILAQPNGNTLIGQVFPNGSAETNRLSLISSYTNAGMDIESAIATADQQLNVPDDVRTMRTREYRDGDFEEEASSALDDLADTNGWFPGGGRDIPSATRAAFLSSVRNRYTLHGNIDAAIEGAKQDFASRWGTTNVGSPGGARLVQDPPERAFGIGNGDNAGWQQEQLRTEISASMGRDLTDSDILLIRDRRSNFDGAQTVFVRDEESDEFMPLTTDGRPYRWRPEYASSPAGQAAPSADEKRRQEREAAVAEVEALAASRASRLAGQESARAALSSSTDKTDAEREWLEELILRQEAQNAQD